jgi:anti-sigma regulatory factor (Ser/Thr protein kinase)
VDEAVTNIIQHGYAGLEPGTIILSVQHGPAQMVLRLTDFGHPFEPVDTPMPDAEEAVAGGEAAGYGLAFIYRSVDDVRYEAAASGNTLTLIKRFAEEAPS